MAEIDPDDIVAAILTCGAYSGSKGRAVIYDVVNDYFKIRDEIRQRRDAHETGKQQQHSAPLADGFRRP
jgi:hypothetical protein